MTIDPILITTALGLLAGGGIGFLIAKSMGDDAKRTKELEDQLTNAKRELSQYRTQVVDHFSKTSDLVNGLTDSYKQVHDHLRTSAVELCNDQFSRHLLSITPPNAMSQPAPAGKEATTNENTVDQPDITPPKDYAPKKHPNEAGTLNEDYGLEKVNLTEQSEKEPSAPTL